MLRHEKDSREVRGENAVPRLEWELLDGSRARVGDAGVVDEGVEPAEVARNLLGERRDGAFVADVAVRGNRVARGLRLASIRDHDLHAEFEKAGRDPGSDAAGTAGDEGCLALEAL